MARRRTRFRNYAEFAVARSILFSVRFLPAVCLNPLSRVLGRLLYMVIRSRRQVVRDNVRLAFGDDPRAPEPDALCRSSLANLCRSFLDLARIPVDRDRAEGLLTIRESEDWSRLKAETEKGPVVFAACHFAAFEIPGVLSGLLGMDATTLARPLDNPLLDRYLNGIRMRFGQRIVGNRGGLRTLVRDLKAGRHAVVLVDLNHRAKQRIFVDYFGTPAATASTAGRLAVRSGRPMVCGFTRRIEKPLRFELDFGPMHWPIPGADREQDVQRLMQLVTNDVEERVRAEPHLWLWTHRRWKTRPTPAEER